MADPHEVELEIAVAEGILPRADADGLRDEARRQQRSPLALLLAQGRLSPDSFASLQAEAASARAAEPAFDPDAPMVLDKGLAAPRMPAGPAFPVPGWDRYTGVRFLGEGGMGRVFLAFDPRLRREVAIKFVRGDAPEHVRRLIIEARAQARVEHERVCRVHEVGEVDGKVYIAMQYIDGVPLGSLAGELTVEQKVMLIRGAAEGIHEAHRAGIVHRDLKPSNILVARGDDGALAPYVMDFGLARTVTEGGATQTGTVLGTPHYMAPEQARGGTSALDRRADVYSLGATLYRLLTGQPPVAGNSLAEIIHNVLTADPRPPRALDPAIPADLQAIVMKCLEKDRDERYDSARALADDLGRFLDGEPVVARAAGAWYRLRKRLARHRRLAVAGALAVIALAAAVGWALHARGEAAERERLARRFTEQVERIEAMARYSALAPAHDIRPDRAAIRGAMTALEDEIRRAGALAAGPGHYALGRGHLTLDDDERARTHLEAAWRLGYREPRVAYALALVMGRRYQRELLAALRIERGDLREETRRRLEREYRDPTLAYLAQSRGADVPSTEYVAALVAFYEGHLDDALRHLDAIGGGLPWFYEASALRGEILFQRGLALSKRGERAGARREFAAGRAAYAAAAAIGESVPSVYESLGELEHEGLVMELYGEGGVMPPFERALAATQRALAIQPNHYPSLVLEAQSYRNLAELRARQGSDAEDVLEKARADIQRAIAAEPARGEARLELAEIYRQWGELRRGRNQDPSAQLRSAIDASETIPAANRDGRYYKNLGLVYQAWAGHEDQRGGDGQAYRDKAIDAYTRALQLDERMEDVWINLGITYLKRASRPRARDADGDLAQAIRALDRARAINPNHIVPYFYEGEIHKLIAQRERAAGRDSEPSLRRALEAYRHGLTINPQLPHLHNGIGLALLDQARAAWDRGAAPGPMLDEASASFERAIAAAPDQGYGYDNIGATFALQAWFRRAAGEDPSASVRAAVEALDRAIARLPDHPTFWADLGMAHAIQAGYELDHGRDPTLSLARADKVITTALAKNPNEPQAQLYLGETRAIGARWRARTGRGSFDAAALDEAARAIQRAIELASGDPDYRLALGQIYRAWAVTERDIGGDPAPALTPGLALANELVALRPSWPDARVLRADLDLVQAQRATGAEQRDHAARADEDFARALAANPALVGPWRDRAALARQLAAAP
ncbi:MAG TPA: protein kinase [Kofleriaceae bacterium]|nr:protein kinase [Kofleriaceae bacterium]